MKKKKKKKKKGPSKIRNPFALPAKMRKAGPMKNPKNKRADEDHNKDYTDESL